MSQAHVVIFGDDGSEHADRAWLWTNNQRWPGWRLDVIAAHVPPLGPPVSEERATPHPLAPPSARQVFAEAAFAEVRFLEAEADPRIVLDRPGAGLVVIGPKGTGTLKALHIGSTAEYLLRHPLAPVAIVRSSATVRRVLVAVDGSTHAQRTVEALAAMPWVDQLEKVEVLGMPAAGIHHDTDEIRSVIERAVDTLAAVGVKAGGVEAADHKVGTIVDHAQILRADLVALGTRGPGGLKRLLSGTAASTVARATPCTVLIASAMDEQTDADEQPAGR